MIIQFNIYPFANLFDLGLLCNTIQAWYFAGKSYLQATTC